MATYNLTSRRLIFMSQIGAVSHWPDGRITLRSQGRDWNVGKEIAKLVAAGYAEPDPDTDDFDTKGYRLTRAGQMALDRYRNHLIDSLGPKE